jgi:uncharacterized protein YkwD/LysM repeat protein
MSKSWSWLFVLVILLTACNTSPTVETVTPTTTLAPTGQATTAAPEATAPATDTPTVTPSPTTAPSPTATPTATPDKLSYTVHPGDTLIGLARQYHTSMASIQLTNGLGDSQSLRAGQKLDIPTGPRFEGESSYWIVHVVQKGDTLSVIAQAFGVAQNDIARVNGISDPALIRSGQSIVIPLEAFRVASLPPTPTSLPTPASQVTPTSQLTLTSQLTATNQATPTNQPPPTSQVTPTSQVASNQSTPVPLASPLATSSPSPATPTVAPASVPSDIADWPNMVVAIINDKRVDSELKRYKVSPVLAQAAQALANDCSSRGWCSHVGSDGSDTRTRILRTGYTPSLFGENWVQANDPNSAVMWWYNETPPNDPHRQNLLHRVFTEIGVGIARAGQGYYFVVDFGSR